MQSVTRLVASRILRPSFAGHQGTALVQATGVQSTRWLSTKPEDGGLDSHDDFKPQFREAKEALSVHESIEKDIGEHPVMVYMKGVPTAPQCGFSAMVVRILDHHGVPFTARNVLADEELRQGIKTFSQWPTVPQVYINGEFVGGCDIIMDMQKTGQLKTKLEEVKNKVGV